MSNSDVDPQIRIIGVDPGTRVTGYAVIEIGQKGPVPIDFGCIRPPTDALLSSRYLAIYQGLQEIVARFSPQEMALETPFAHKNYQSTIKLGMCLGACIICAKEKDLRVFGYTPKQVKLSVTATGNATKEQMQESLTRLFGLNTLITPQDAADALGVALCHSQLGGTAKQITQKEL